MARSGKWPVGAAQVGGAAQRDGRRRALLGVVLRVGGKERGKERERLSARFAAAVGHARTAAFGRSATSTQDERKGKGNTRTGIEFGCRNGGFIWAYFRDVTPC